MIKLEFDKNILNFKELTKKAFENFKIDNPKFKDYKVLIVNTVQKNLKSILAHGFPYPNAIKRNYIHCENKQCNTCFYSNHRNMIYLKENFILPILTNGSCDSKDVVFIIFCSIYECFICTVEEVRLGRARTVAQHDGPGSNIPRRAGGNSWAP